MKLPTITIVVATLLLCPGVGKAGEGSYSLFDVNRGTSIPLDPLVPELMNSRILLVGERHTEMSHHEAQHAVIQALHAAGVSVAVGLEMFRSQSQDILDRWGAGQISREDFEYAYYSNWTFPWRLYSRIFHYAREKSIPLVGLNVPRNITRQVARKGFQSLSPEQRSQLPDTVVCRVDEDYMAFIQRAYGAHAHGKMNFTFFCEAQLVWDQAMAITALRYLDAHPNRAMVILAGIGHTWRWGVPEQIRLRSDISPVVILPRIPGAVEPGITTPEDADYIIHTQAPGS
jgi:uncharacterized iron-regulated protein